MKAYDKYKPSSVDWIGDIPEHWQVKRLKWICAFEYGDSLATDNRDTGEVPVFGSNGITGYHSKAITKAPCIIIGRKGSFGKINWSDEKCFPIDTTYFVDETKTSNNLKWLFYLLQNLELDSFSKDTGVPGLSREDAYSKVAPFPSPSEQTAIADYLDEKTAQIDSLIKNKVQLIQLLKEERTAIINQAVTRGINPNIKFGHSGIGWLGDIPEHWKVVPLTKYLESIIDYRGKTPTKSDSGVFLVTARNIKNGEINYSLSQEYILEEEFEKTMQRGALEIGDVLFTTEAPLGEAANVDRTDVAVAQRVIKFRARKGILNNYFLKHWILSPMFQQDLMSYATGSTALGIKGSKLFHLKLLLPPIDEQQAILDFIAEQSKKFENTIVKIEKEIGFMREYRTALISEVVTGKIKVV